MSDHCKFFEEKLTGKKGIVYDSCESPAGIDESDPFNRFNGIINERELVQAFGMVWKCTRKVEDGSLRLELFACSVERFRYRYLDPGESRTMNNGSVKHSCDIVDGGLRSIFEYENGTYYIQKEIVRPYVRLNNFYEKSDLVLVEHSDGIQRSKQINTRRFKCVETKPGHVTLITATEEDMSCRYKNGTYSYESIWIDVTRGASLRCDNGNEVMKEYCSLNGKNYDIGLELKLSNGCVFVCNEHKNIYICEEPLKL
ncbi:hypothetical protein CRE_21258 [Caenorhabditis remanei]|uniref:Uncharacterized protein n=1 Tax=Caenorhabditis remanei TaxID=31234 RepID=E3MF52_CAERE|nr:hypothetical protein CRE_21258 [Caenorhabditis remanei]